MPEYTKQEWADGDPTKTASAARFAFMEEGIRRASIVIVTSLPVAPEHGDEVYYEVESGLLWPLVYDSTIVDDYKWVAYGAPALTDQVLTSETTTSTTYADMATVGPTVTVPLAGIYQIAFGATLSPSTASGAAAVKLGAAATSDNEMVQSPSVGSTSLWREIEREVNAAAAVVKLQYRMASAGTLTAVRRNLSVRPLRVG